MRQTAHRVESGTDISRKAGSLRLASSWPWLKPWPELKFKKISDVSTPQIWRDRLVLARDLYIRRINPAGPLSGYNIDTFRFTGNNPNALLMDAPAAGGNGNGVADETEIGNANSDAIIDS